jgi:hypothetical protein
MKYRIGDLVCYGGLMKGIVLQLDKKTMCIFWLANWSINPQWYEQADRYIKKLEAK